MPGVLPGPQGLCAILGKEGVGAMSITVSERARILVESVRTEIRLGTKHWNREGKPLTTAREVLACMIEEGGVTFEPIEERKGLFHGYDN